MIRNLWDIARIKGLSMGQMISPIHVKKEKLVGWALVQCETSWTSKKSMKLRYFMWEFIRYKVGNRKGFLGLE